LWYLRLNGNGRKDITSYTFGRYVDIKEEFWYGWNKQGRRNGKINCVCFPKYDFQIKIMQQNHKNLIDDLERACGCH